VVFDFIGEETFWQMMVKINVLNLAYALLFVATMENTSKNDGLRVRNPSYILFFFLHSAYGLWKIGKKKRLSPFWHHNSVHMPLRDLGFILVVTDSPLPSQLILLYFQHLYPYLTLYGCIAIRFSL
jgi:hypothetical protein